MLFISNLKKNKIKFGNKLLATNRYEEHNVKLVHGCFSLLIKIKNTEID